MPNPIEDMLATLPANVRTYWEQHPDLFVNSFRQMLLSASTEVVDIYTALLASQYPARTWQVATNNNSPLVEDTARLRLIPVLKRLDEDERLSGPDLSMRAKQLNAMFGVEQAHWLLNHQAAIPADWQTLTIFFPGAVWHNAEDHDDGMMLRLQCMSGIWVADFCDISLSGKSWCRGWQNDRFLIGQ